MSNNLYYKIIAALGTLGIVVLSATQVWTSLKVNNNTENQLSKTLVELKKIRKESLNEINVVRNEIMKEIKDSRKEIFEELNGYKNSSLFEIKETKKEAVNSLKNVSGGSGSGVSMLIRYTGGGGTSMVTVPMQSFDQCELAGATMEASKRFTSTDRNIGFECVETGKWNY